MQDVLSGCKGSPCNTSRVIAHSQLARSVLQPSLRLLSGLDVGQLIHDKEMLSKDRLNSSFSGSRQISSVDNPVFFYLMSLNITLVKRNL